MKFDYHWTPGTFGCLTFEQFEAIVRLYHPNCQLGVNPNSHIMVNSRPELYHLDIINLILPVVCDKQATNLTIINWIDSTIANIDQCT